MSSVSEQPDRITGRVTAVDQQCIRLWREDQILTFFLGNNLQPICAPGDLVEVSLDKSGTCTGLSVLAKPIAGHDDPLRWRKPDRRGRTRMEHLRFRHALIRRVEAWFDKAGFLQVQMPALLPSVNPEAHFQFIRGEDHILSTSPELQMKRMLVGGFEKIVSLGACYRGHERSARHNPEFWMLEWYRVGASLEMVMEDTEEIVRVTAHLSPWVDSDGNLHLEDGTHVALSGPRWPRVPVSQHILQETGVDIDGCLDVSSLGDRMRSRGMDVPDDEEFEQLFSRLWAASEPGLPRETPCFVTDWPAPVASLARLSPGRPWVAERAELVIAGLELSNGFCELTDSREQAARFAAETVTRSHRGLPPVPSDGTFIASLNAGMPPSAGMALGFDRLVMLLSGAASIRDVLTFSSDEL